MKINGTDKKSVTLKKAKLLYIAVYTPRADTAYASHSHAFTEMMFVKEGGCIFRAGEGTYRLKKGDVIMYGPGTVHSESFPDENCSVVFLGIDRVQASGRGENILPATLPVIVQAGKYYDSFVDHIDRLLEENEAKAPYYGVISDSLLLIVISLVLRLAGTGNGGPEERNAYREAKDFLDRNFTTIDSIDDVSKSLYINKYYLTHLFKDSTGVPPLRYIIGKRMDLACRLLGTTDNPIGDVAKACGYTDTAYFCRLFKKVMDETPLSYRKRQREERPKED